MSWAEGWESLPQGAQPRPLSPPQGGRTAHTVAVELLLVGAGEPGLQACCTGMFWLLRGLRGQGCCGQGKEALVRAPTSPRSSPWSPAAPQGTALQPCASPTEQLWMCSLSTEVSILGGLICLQDHRNSRNPNTLAIKPPSGSPWRIMGMAAAEGAG